MVNWSQAEKDQVTAYINAGFTVAVPEYGDLTQRLGLDGHGLSGEPLTTANMLTAAYVGSVCSGALRDAR